MTFFRQIRHNLNTAQPSGLAISRRAIAGLILILLPLLFFYPAVIGKVVLMPGDGWTQNLGVRVLIGQMIAQGQVPFWNPLIFAGTPLLASVYPGALYPPNWLFALFSPLVAMNIVVITTYHIALIGSYFYGRKVGMTRLGAILTGTGFTFGAFMICHLGHTSRIAAAAWLPWILLAVEHLYCRASWRWTALGASFIALQLFAGEPQMNAYTAMVVGAYGIFSLTLREAKESRWRFILMALVMGLCGILLSAVQLFPERELLQQGERAKITLDYFSQFSIPPRQILGLIFPYFFGGAATRPYLVFYWGEWNVAETASYTGLLTLLLGLIAIVKPLRNRLIWFWLGTAIVAILLAFGSHLPFGLNNLLYQVPVYNLFRAPGRHILEFTFALAVLAGFGVTNLTRLSREEARRPYLIAAGILSSVFFLTTVIYRFYGEGLKSSLPRPDYANSLANAEFLLPLVCLLSSFVVVWFYIRKRTLFGGGLLIVVLLFDLATFGQIFEWVVIPFHKYESRVTDQPTTTYLKKIDPDLNSFRIASQTLRPFLDNYDMLNYPNVSIGRGIQSVNGYDALRLQRTATLGGEMTLDGIPQDWSVYNNNHQGFNLLNVKYLMRERLSLSEAWRGILIEGILFNSATIDLKLTKGQHEEITPGSVVASELAIISSLGNSTHITDGTPVVRVKIYAKNGTIIEREIQTGRDTSEWAYDRADVTTNAKHRRATIAESWPLDGFQGHRFLARLKFARAEIERIEFDYLLPEAEIMISRASLFDEQSSTSTQLDNINLPPARWKKLDSFGQVEIYENLKKMPRAWLVKKIVVQTSAEVQRIIRSGTFSDGSPFDPAETVLMETEDFGGREISLPSMGELSNPVANITNYSAHHIKLETDNPADSFLVLSEIYYRGWDARVDGKKAPVYRVNHALRGISLPPGKHQIEFVYRAPSFWNGAIYASLGFLFLLIGGIFSLTRHRSENSEKNVLNHLAQNIRLELAQLKLPTENVAPVTFNFVELNQAFIPAIILLGFCSLWMIYVNNLNFLPIRSDGVGYYLYLPAVFIDKDLTLETTINRQFAGKAEEWMGVARYPTTGRLLNRYPIGEAIMLSPFFLTGHIIAKLLGVSADGFSWPYQLTAAFAGLFYLIAGLILLRNILSQYFSIPATFLSLIAITFGTNLFHYGTCDNIFSHIFSFFLFCTLLFLSNKIYQQPDKLHFILLGIAGGLLTIVRPTNVLFLVFVPLLNVYNLETLKGRLKFVSSQLSSVVTCAVAYLLMIFPLLLYWKFITGRWLVNSYQGLSFNWTNPEIINVLFSVRKGLLFWSPFLILGIIGLFFVTRYWKGILLPAVMLLLLHTYVVSSWPAWWYGGSFGHRAFTETLPIFAIGYAALLETTREKPVVYRGILIGSCLLMLLSIKSMIQYWNGVIPYDESTIAILVSTFFQLAK